MPKRVHRKYRSKASTLRSKQGRYVSVETKLSRVLGGIVVLLVALFYVRGMNAEFVATHLEPLARHAMELEVHAGELEIQAARQMQKVNKELVVQSNKRVARITAYSCNGIKSAKERLMNCPNGITSDGSIPTAGKTVACDKSLLGKRVQIAGIGERKCQDTGGAIVGDRIDLYVNDIATAYQFGVKSFEYTVID